MPSPEPSRSTSFATDVLKLVTGTTFAQVITILASPLLTRLYGPEAFGFLALFTSITSIIGVVACMRYEMAIMLPKTDEEAANLLGLCLLCVAVVSGLTVPALYFGGDAILSMLRAPGLEPYLILVPVFVFISGVFLALNYWNSRTKHFGRLSVARVISSLAAALGAGDLPDRRGEVEHLYPPEPKKTSLGSIGSRKQPIWSTDGAAPITNEGEYLFTSSNSVDPSRAGENWFNMLPPTSPGTSQTAKRLYTLSGPDFRFNPVNISPAVA